MTSPTPDPAPTPTPTQSDVAAQLQAQGFTQDQINAVVHAMVTTSQRQDGDPLGTIRLGTDGLIYVRVAIPDVVGDVHKWRVIDTANGTSNQFNAEPIIAGSTLIRDMTPVVTAPGA